MNSYEGCIAGDLMWPTGLEGLGGGGGWGCKGLMETCGQPGYVFRDFCLKQVSILSIFVLNRVYLFK